MIVNKGYFDNAATTLMKPQGMYQFVADYMQNYGANASRGNYATAKSAGKIIRETRDLLLDLVNAPKTKEVVFTPSATIAINTILSGQALNEGDVVYISPFEHNAVIRTLIALQKNNHFEIEYLKLKNDVIDYDLDLINRQFSNKPPRLLIISHVSNVLGLIAPVEEIAKLSKNFNATVIIDAAQSCGNIDITVGNFIDYYIFAGHKTLLAPFGIAGFICNKNSSLPPFIYGGTGIDSASSLMPSTIPERFEAGSMNIMAIAGLNYSLNWIKDNLSFIKKMERDNFARLKSILIKYNFIKIIEPVGQCTSIISCKFDGLTSDEAGRILSSRGISVRTGLHCAPLAHKYLNSFPEGLVRFSISCFTNDEDFIILEEVLDDVADEL